MQQRERLLAKQPSKETGEKVSEPPPQRQGAPGICGIKNKAAGWSEVYGAWGKSVGKRCSNHRSAQV